MAVTGMHYNWGWGFGASWSTQYNFAPSYAAAQVSCIAFSGGGLHATGITQYLTRPDPNGPDQPVNFSWNTDFGYPPSVYDPNMTSVTAELDLGEDQEGVMTLNVWFFG